MAMVGELDGKVAVITGAASGFGLAASRIFVAEGARVIMADVQDDAGQAAAAELGASARYVHADVSDSGQVASMIGAASSTFGRLDVVFNNAGISGDFDAVPLTDYDFREFDRVIEIDLRGVMYGVQHAARYMQYNGGGSIINTGSTGATWAGPYGAAYRSAKAGVLAFTRNAALELGRHAIRVNSVSPGGFPTPMMENLNDGVREMASRLLEIQSLKTVGQAEDIGNAALFLASDRSRHITGQNIVVDGGASLGTPI
jgi:NAD(P)-dependent dehydrogenase (short-subunit alcohol dehydrogenase family)